MVTFMFLLIFLRVFLVDVGQNVQNRTNFNLTLSVNGLTTSVIFPVIVQSEWYLCVYVCVCVWRRCRLSWYQDSGEVWLVSNISTLHVECTKILILCTEKVNGGIK